MELLAPKSTPKRGLAAALLAALAAPCGTSPPAAAGDAPLADPARRDKVVLVLLDGVGERSFRSLLEAGELPHLAALLQPEGHLHGVYTAATSTWPTTTGPAYAPFVTGLFAGPAGLSGIRQFLRDEDEVRVYQLRDLRQLGDDLVRSHPTLYEVLGREETFNQQGWLTRRGWNAKTGRAHRPLHENFSSTPGVIEGGLRQIPGAEGLELAKESDRYNALSFLNYVTPPFDPRKLDAVARFPGREFDWGGAAVGRLFGEGIFSLLGLERIASERRLGAVRLGGLPRFSFLSLHLPDETAHRLGPGGEGRPSEAYRRALRGVDELVGLLVAVLRAEEELDEVTWIVTSDHGESAVGPEPDRHVDVIAELSRRTGLPIRMAPKRGAAAFNRAWKRGGQHRDSAGVAAVSGNAHVELYLRKPGARDWSARPGYQDLRAYSFRGSPPVDVLAALLEQPAVGLVCAVDREHGRYHVLTRDGAGVIRSEAAPDGGRRLAYAVSAGRDPLGYADDQVLRAMMGESAFHDGDAWAAASRDTGHPDAIVQIVQLLDGARTGDVVLDAAPGYEPWDEAQLGLHGALRREQLLVPLLIRGPRLDPERARALFATGRLPRTVDVYPTILSLLGVDPPDRITWEERPFRFGPLRHASAPVSTRIDGQPLPIWCDAPCCSDPAPAAASSDGER